jgi:hypothetical protein
MAVAAKNVLNGTGYYNVHFKSGSIENGTTERRIRGFTTEGHTLDLDCRTSALRDYAGGSKLMQTSSRPLTNPTANIVPEPSEESLFSHRFNEDSAFDSICKRCFGTVGHCDHEADLARAEKRHFGDPCRIEHYRDLRRQIEAYRTGRKRV